MNPPVDRADLAERLAFVVGSVNRRLRPPAEAPHRQAWVVGASIARAGSVRPGDLARVEGITAPSTTRLVAELEQRGLVTRTPDPDDGRSHRVEVTEAGSAALTRARQERSSAVAELLAGTDDAELQTLQAAVETLEAALLTVPARQRARA